MTDFEVTRGDGPQLPLHVTNPDGTNTDLTGSTLTFTAKLDRDDTDGEAVISKTSVADAGILITEPATAGRAIVQLEDEDTEDLPAWTVLWYDVQMAEAGTEPITVIRGRLLVTPDVTRTSI
jgi:hypothetical protein